MKIKFLIAGIIMLLISLNSCDDKTQTTQTQTKSDVNLLLSPNPVTDSIQASILLPFVVGHVNSYDSLISIEEFAITHDNSGRKYFYFRYLSSTSEVDDFVFKYYDPADTTNYPGVAAGIVTVQGKSYTCEGGCSDGRCKMCLSGLNGGNPDNYLCQCTEAASSTCSKVEVTITIGPNHKNSGLNIMQNINIQKFVFVPYTIEMP